VQLRHTSPDPGRDGRIAQLVGGKGSRSEELLEPAVKEGAEESGTEVIDGGKGVEGSDLFRSRDEGGRGEAVDSEEERRCFRGVGVFGDLVLCVSDGGATPPSLKRWMHRLDSLLSVIFGGFRQLVDLALALNLWVAIIRVCDVTVGLAIRLLSLWMSVREEEDGIGERTGDFVDVEVLCARSGRRPVRDSEGPEESEQSRAKGVGGVFPGCTSCGKRGEGRGGGRGDARSR
jgi:hypothetical protein